MDLIEDLNPNAFAEYLKKYDNTICGRHPIAVLLQVCLSLEDNDFFHYEVLQLPLLFTYKFPGCSSFG